jgi:hypothetical protein
VTSRATPPFACVRSRSGSGRTICGRSPDSDEFLFEDADRAAEHYADSKTIRLCSECLSMYAAVRKKEQGAA